LTKPGIIIMGGLAFTLLAVACVAQQAGDFAQLPSTRIAPVELPRVKLPAVPRATPSTTSTTEATEPLPEPVLRAEFNAAAPLVLTGRVPDAGVRDAVVERARRLYGQAHVRDQLTITPVNRPAWLNAAFPPDLRDTRLATALLQDGRLLVIGETGSDSARARVDAALAPFAAQNVTVDVRLNAGVVEPAQAGVPPGQSRSGADAGGRTVAAGGR
jgi:hypothetical protein